MGVGLAIVALFLAKLITLSLVFSNVAFASVHWKM